MFFPWADVACAEQNGKGGHHQVPDGGDGQQFDHEEVRGIDVRGDTQQFEIPDRRGQRRRFQHHDVLVAGRGQDDPAGLGNDDAAQNLRLDRLRRQLDATDRLRETLSYKATLERGYAVVRAGDQVVTSAGAARSAPLLEIEFRDGRVTAAPTDAPEAPPASGTPPAPSAPKKTPRQPNPKAPPEQGTLF